MAKRPRPGRSKTRLTTLMSADAAAELSACMITDTVRSLSGRDDCRVVIAVDSVDGLGWFAERFPGHALIVQRGVALGERLDGVMGDLLDQGFDQVWAIGSDSPGLPEDHVSSAFQLLLDRSVDVVFGPTDDGGYYLVGWKSAWSPVLTDVEMSTPTVLDDSLAIAASAGARVALAPRWFDVDEPVDLERIRSASVLPPDSATGRFLEEFDNR